MNHLLPRALPSARALLRPSNPSSLRLPPASRALSTTASCQADQKLRPRRDADPPPTITPDDLAARPWVMARTPYAQLPVYRDYKAGGNKILVLVKKVQGDKKLFVEELAAALGPDADKAKIRINPTTQHVEVTGDYFSQTRNWLLERGF